MTMFSSFGNYYSSSLTDYGLSALNEPVLIASPKELPRTPRRASNGNGNDDELKIGKLTVSESNPDEFEERVQVDRKRLEQMISGSGDATLGESLPTAEDFFSQVMRLTGVHISWPTRLKIGAKTKKDPFVKISGPLDRVHKGKDMVLAVLRTKQNRVTLKLDVPFTDHSHIIGRGGKNTQEVMKQTACHIHFPDSNKNHDSDKSNQVSIAGPIGKVEVARSRIRGLAPLSISFELKGVKSSVNVEQLVADAGLEKTLGFAELNIVVRTNRASGQPYCLVRGSAHQMNMMADACVALRHFFFPSGTSVSYSTTLEVLPGQQASLIGQGGRHIQWIVQKTGAVVQYPSVTECQRGASTFYIVGSVESILIARKYILGLLPVQLSFEVRKENAKANQPDPTTIEQQLGVALALKYRPNGGEQGSKAVTVRSYEFNLTSVYAVRGRMVDPTDETTVCTDYDFMRDMRAIIDPPTALPSLMSANQNGCNLSFPSSPITPSHLTPPHPLLYAGFNPFMFPQHGYNMAAQAMTTPLMYQQQTPHSPHSPLLPSPQSPYSPHSHYHQHLQMYANPAAQHIQQHQQSLPPTKQWLQSERGRVDSRSTGLGSSVSSERSSPPEIDSDHSTTDEQQAAVMTAALKSVVTNAGDLLEPPTTPKTTAISPNPNDSPIAHSVLNGAKKINEQNGIAWKAPGIERRPLTSDRDQMRMKATQAMNQSPTHGAVRTPTEQWSGLFFSKSTPADVLKKQLMASPQTNKCQTASLRFHSRASREDDNENGSPNGGGPLPSVMEDDDGEDNCGPIAPKGAYSTPTPRSANCLTALRRSTDFAATSYFDSASPQSPYLNLDWDIRVFRDPSMVLAALGLSDYYGHFREQEIDMEAFLLLDEQNLKDLGVTTIGARKKLRIAILKLNESAAMYGQQ